MRVLFNKMKEPIFLRESSNAELQLEKIKILEPLLNSEGQAIIRHDVKALEAGIVGEKNIAFELKNSHMPIYILHDIYLEDGDLSAQIDYIVITKKLNFIIECKNLYGDIEITSTGDFIRTTEFGGKKKKEGIYSPITQNQRHLELLKKLRMDSRGNILNKMLTDRYFEDFNKSVVVLANPKTVLNAKFAKKELKDKVIRADQLVKYIKDMYEKSKETADSDQRMLERAHKYLNLHKDVYKDYTGKYNKYLIETDKPVIRELEVQEELEQSVVDIVPIEETGLYTELKAYRLKKSREENAKPYIIYNDNQLKDLISNMPINKEELKLVAGFSKVKANKYGDDILKIIAKYFESKM